MSTTLANMGLIKWDSTADYFSHTQLAANFQAIDDHDHTGSPKGLQIPAGGLAANAVTSTNLAANSVQTAAIADFNVTAGKLADGAVTAAKIASTDLDKLGLSSSVVRRGKTIISTEEARTNATYDVLTTADRVSNVVLPTDGLIFVAYQAMWQETNVGAARAAIFIGTNQLRYANGTTATTNLQETTSAGNATNQYHPLSSTSQGLVAVGAGGSSAYGGDVTTGQVVGMTTDATGGSPFQGGPCSIFAAAGTYTISVQFKASAGTVTVKNRKLWVWTMGF